MFSVCIAFNSSLEFTAVHFHASRVHSSVFYTTANVACVHSSAFPCPQLQHLLLLLLMQLLQLTLSSHKLRTNTFGLQSLFMDVIQLKTYKYSDYGYCLRIKFLHHNSLESSHHVHNAARTMQQICSDSSKVLGMSDRATLVTEQPGQMRV